MLKHVQRGDLLRIAADDWNRVIDATRAHYEAQGAARRPVSMSASLPAGTILVKNATGQDQPRFAVLGINAPIIPPEDNLDEFQRQVALSCVTPTAEHARRFVILQEPLASGGIGRACASGVTNVKIQTDDPDVTEILTAGIAEGETNWLIAGGHGCTVLWAEEESQPEGWRWAIVRLGDSGRDIFPARITSADNGAHAWVEAQPTSGGGAFGNLAGGRSGTTSEDPAYEINGRTNVPANTIVWMRSVSASDGSVIYLFDLGMGNPGSPLGMTYSGEHGENASNVTWDINNQSSNRGVSLTVQTGSRYDHNAATPTLYAYLRTLTFDANGHLMAVGPESRVVIDTPEACP